MGALTFEGNPCYQLFSKKSITDIAYRNSVFATNSKFLIPVSLQSDFYIYNHLIFQSLIIWSNRIHSLKYLRSRTLVSEDIEVIKSEFLAAKAVIHLTFHTICIIYEPIWWYRMNLTYSSNFKKVCFYFRNSFI